MVNKKRFVFLLIIFLLPAFVFSQIQESEEASDFMQHLEWEEAEYASRYQIVVEMKRINTFVEVVRRIIEEPFVDVSVPSGQFRYKIFSFNVLGRLDTESDWIYFDVIQAQQPSIFSYVPESFFFDRPSLRMIRIEGANLFLDSEIYLLRRNNDPNAEEEKIVPSEIRRNDLGEFADLYFAEEELIEGIYDIVVENPGGLVTAAGPFGISVAKPFDINVSAGYAPMVKIYGNTTHVIDEAFIPLGFFARGSFIPFKWKAGFLGIEANLTWAHLSSDSNGFITSASMLGFYLGPLYQYWFNKNILALNFRIGMGISSLLNYRFEFDTGAVSDPLNSAFISVFLGASAQYFFYKQLFAEAGLELMHAAAQDLPMGFIRFTVSMGWQF